MRLPVFTAFGASVSYIAAHFLTLLRITWAPALLLMAVMTYVMPALSQAQLDMIAIEQAGGGQGAIFGALGEVVKANGLIMLASALFYPMMIAGVLKHVLHGETPRLPFYLWYGADELRVFIAYILFIVMVMVAAIAGALAMTVIGAVAALISSTVGGIIAAVMAVAAIVAFIWFLLRMSLLFAASVAERTIGIGRSWQITGGATWSLFFYWLLWVIVMMVIGAIYAGFAASDIFSLIPEMIATGGDEAAMQEIERRMQEAQLEMYDVSRPGYWLYAGATYVYTIVTVSFWTAASGVAWRYLAGEERG